MAQHSICMAHSTVKRKGAWTPEEDKRLREYVQMYGEGSWHRIPSTAGLNRCRKSCRLRWLNYLSPGIKRGAFSIDETDLIIRMHKLLGNRWTLIAGRLPRRTANDVKNYWNSRLSKRASADHENYASVKVMKPKPFHLVKSFQQLDIHQIARPETSQLEVANSFVVQPAPAELLSAAELAPIEHSLPMVEEENTWSQNATDELLPTIEEEGMWDAFLKDYSFRMICQGL